MKAMTVFKPTTTGYSSEQTEKEAEQRGTCRLFRTPQQSGSSLTLPRGSQLLILQITLLHNKGT